MNNLSTRSMDVKALQRKNLTMFQMSMRKLFTIRSAVFGMVVLFILIFAAIFAPYLTPYKYGKIAPREALQAPSAKHLLGTDHFGRDVLTRVMYGGRYSLTIGLIALCIGGGAGLILGLLSGYFGGVVDDVIMRFIDILLAFPGILLAMAVVAVLGISLPNLMISVGIGIIPGFARLVRSSVIALKNAEYIVAARALGVSDMRILVRHILPNAAAPIIVYATLSVATAILSSASLSFLGMGAKPPTPEWGIMLSDGRQTLASAWWVGLFPGLAITFTSLAINFLGDGLRVVLDPHINNRD